MKENNSDESYNLMSNLEHIDNEYFYKGGSGILYKRACLKRDDSMNNIYLMNIHPSLLYSGLSKENIEIIKIIYKNDQYEIKKEDRITSAKEGAHIVFTPEYVYVIDYEKKEVGKYYRGIRPYRYYDLMYFLEHIDNEYFYKEDNGILYKRACLKRDDSMNNIYLMNIHPSLLYSGLSKENIEIIKITYKNDQYKIKKEDRITSAKEGAHIVFTPEYVYVIDYEKKKAGKYYRGIKTYK